MKIVTKWLEKNVLYFALILAVISTAASLYLSEIRHFPPCSLCWYQRIFMYPLIAVIAVGILRKDKGLHHYVLPLSIAGMIVAFYQILLQQGILLENFTPCTLGVSCVTKFEVYFGFITIPLLSFIAFAMITGLMLFYGKVKKK